MPRQGEGVKLCMKHLWIGVVKVNVDGKSKLKGGGGGGGVM